MLLFSFCDLISVATVPFLTSWLCVCAYACVNVRVCIQVCSPCVFEWIYWVSAFHGYRRFELRSMTMTMSPFRCFHLCGRGLPVSLLQSLISHWSPATVTSFFNCYLVSSSLKAHLSVSWSFCFLSLFLDFSFCCCGTDFQSIIPHLGPSLAASTGHCPLCTSAHSSPAGSLHTQMSLTACLVLPPYASSPSWNVLPLHPFFCI